VIRKTVVLHGSPAYVLTLRSLGLGQAGCNGLQPGGQASKTGGRGPGAFRSQASLPPVAGLGMA